MHKLAFLIPLVLAIGASAVGADVELSPLGIPQQLKSLYVDAHFEDRDRKNLVIEASSYRISVFVPQPRIESISVRGEEVVRGAVLQVSTGRGVYSSAFSSKRPRLNIWRHGPYYYEIHILNFPLTNSTREDLPARGELVFYCYPDKFHIQAIVRPSEDLVPDSIGLDYELANSVWLGETGAGDGLNWHAFTMPQRLPEPGTGRRDRKPAFAVVTPAEVNFRDTVRAMVAEARMQVGECKKDDEESVWLAVLPAGGDVSLEDRVRAELSPLTAKQFTASGGAFDGYDRVRGHYALRTRPAMATHGFESFWVNPNQYLATDFKVKNDDLDRRIYVKHYTTGLGCLEAGVVTDRYGFPLPMPVQACKNFAGEHEEPDDTAFGESYFPLALNPGQSLQFRSYHLLQNWGNHPLKQVSSIRFFEHYYHLSTGVTETTCYVPLTKHARPDAGYSIADFRGMSGITWLGQPQHHHVALIGFLQYYDGEWRNLRYLNTDFEYISPNLAKFTMNYMSDDDKIKASVGVMEIPQLDETRSFVHLRYDVLEPVEIEGDIRRNLRFVNANTDITRNKYQKVAYLGEDDEVKEVDLKYEDSWILEGVPLSKDRPFICMYASPKSNNSFIVLRCEGRIGGKPLDRLGTSVVGYKSRIAEQFLTVTTTGNKLLPGDYLEADVILMPYGYDWHDWRPPNRERTYYGSAGPEAKAIHGIKLGDFPAEIHATADGYAEFEISGGHDYLPLIVKGLPQYNAPMLWEKAGLWNFVDQQVKGNDWYQVVAGEHGFDFVFLIRQRNGMKHHYLVTQASCDTGIESVRAENAEVIVKAPKSGNMRILSPRLFETLVNRVAAGSPVICSEGVAEEARTVPVLVSAKSGAADVTVKRVGQDGYDIEAGGTAELEFAVGHLRDFAEYSVRTPDGVRTVVPDRGGTARFQVDVKGTAKVEFRPAG